MLIEFSINLSEPNRLEKNLVSKTQVSGLLKDSTNITKPILLVNANVKNTNYFHIPDFNRSYFVESITSVKNGLWEVVADRVDVLGSFADYLKNCDCIIDKAESNVNANKYINDGSYIIQSNEAIEIKNFPAGFNDSGEFILICAGG